MIWKLADAKNKFSEVVSKALEEGPQKITRRSDAVIIVALKDFERLSDKKPGFKEYLKSAPSMKGIDFKRDRSPFREAAL